MKVRSFANREQFFGISNDLDSSISKPRPTVKLVKSQSTNDIKSAAAAVAATKKKEVTPLPLKTKINLNPQVVIKKTITKIPGKPSIKPEPTSTSTVKSPPNTSIKQEPSPPPPPPSTATNTTSNNISSSASINSLKKIPKKPIPAKGEEKRSQSLKPPSTADRKSTISKDSHKQPTSSSSISKPKVKRDSSLAPVKVSNNNNNSNSNNKERLSKIKPVKGNCIPNQ